MHDLTKRIAEYQRTNDISLLYAPEADREAMLYVKELAIEYDHQSWSEACRALGLLHWYRFLDERLANEGLAAAAYFSVVNDLDPAAVPLPLQEFMVAQDFDLHSYSRGHEYEQAKSFRAYYQQTGHPHLLWTAVRVLRWATAEMTLENPARSEAMASLGATLVELFGSVGDVEVLDDAIAILREASASAPAADPALGGYLNNLGGALCQRGGHGKGRLADLDEAVRVLREAVQLAVPADNVITGRLCNLGVALTEYATRAEDSAALDEAIAVLRRGVMKGKAGSQSLVKYLAMLGKALGIRAERIGAESDHLESRDVWSRAVNLSRRRDSKDLPLALTGLSAQLLHLFRREQDKLALVQAIALLHESAVLTHPASEGHRSALSLLSTALTFRHGQPGGDPEADDLWQHYLASVSLTVGQNQRASELEHLSDLLWRRYRRTDDEADLREALAVMQMMVAVAPSRVARAAALSEVANAARFAFERFGNEDDLARALAAAQASVAITDPDNSMTSRRLFQLGVILWRRIEARYEDALAVQALAALRTALASGHLRLPQRVDTLAVLGNVIILRADAQMPDVSLDEAVDCLREALRICADDHVNRRGYLFMLGRALLSRHEVTQSHQDFSDAIEAFTLSSGSDYQLLARLSQMAIGQYVGQRTALALEQACSLAQRAMTAVESATANRTEQAHVAGILADAMYMRWEADRGSESGSALAEAALRRSFDLLPEGHADRLKVGFKLHDVLLQQSSSSHNELQQGESFQILSVLASEFLSMKGSISASDDASTGRDALYHVTVIKLLLKHYYLSEDEGSFRTAVTMLREFMNQDEDTSGELAQWASSLLSAVLFLHYERTGAPEDLDEAIEMQRTLRTFDDRVELGGMLISRFEIADDAATLNEAIEVLRGCVNDATHQMGRSETLRLLGVCLRYRYEYFGQISALGESITCGQEAVNLADSEEQRLRCMSAVAGALREDAERQSDLAALDAATDIMREALNGAQPGDPARAVRLSALAPFLHRRYSWTRDSDDLDEAVELGRQSIDESKPLDPDLPTRLTNFASALVSRYDRKRDSSDLAEAIASIRRALRLTPAGHAQVGIRLGQLSVALQTEGEVEDSDSTIDEAVRTAEQAVETIREGHFMLAILLINQGQVRYARYQRSGDLNDLASAIDALRRAVATASDHPTRAAARWKLGDLLVVKARRAKDVSILREALPLFETAADSETADTGVRVSACASWGNAAAELEDWPLALRASKLGVELASRLVARSLGRDDQEHEVAGFADIAALAATAAVRCGEPGQAVELLEQGRGILLARAFDSRSELSDLEEKDPSLAEEVKRCSHELDLLAQSEPGLGLAVGPRISRSRTEALARWNHVIDSVRRVPGFSNFFLPPTVDALSAAARTGSVVYVNVTARGSFALFLEREGVMRPALELSAATYSEVTQLARECAQVTSVAHLSDIDVLEEANERLLDVLDKLWILIAEPVLRELGIDGPPEPGKPWPRIHWCPVGQIAFLPLHAAGRYSRERATGVASVLDRAVSCYVPTARALMLDRRRVTDLEANATGRSGMLAVAVPYMPGQRDLPNALNEVERLENDFNADTLVAGEAKRARVLAELPRYGSVHFACHAYSDSLRPSQSHLLLYDRPLTVLDIARLHQRRAELAFLSACSTARPTDQLTDEAIHLSSAFQLAGYAHVIATLWPVRDSIADRMTEAIYAHINNMGTTNALAEACHTAVRNLRQEFPDLPMVWAAHIHAGP